MYTRRTLLAAVGTVVGAGCLGHPTTTATEPSGDNQGDDVSPTEPQQDTQTGHKHTGSDDDCRESVHVTADRFDPVEQLPLRLTEPEMALIDTAIKTGSATFAQYGETPPIADDAYVVFDEQYYRTAVDQTGTTEIPALVLNVEWKKGQSAPADATVREFSTLPDADREALHYAIYRGGSDERGNHPTQGLSVRKSPVPYPDGTGTSELTGAGTVWVRWNDRTYRVWTGGTTTATEYSFEIETDRVATDSSTFRTYVRDQYLLDVSTLPDAERDVFRTAIEDGSYRECRPISAALSSVRTRLQESETLPSPLNNSWFVRFDGATYRVEQYTAVA